MSDVVERLKQNRAEWAEAQGDLAIARGRRDIKEVARLTALVAAYEAFISEDEAEAAAEAESLNTAEGAALYHELLNELRAGLESFDGEVEAVKDVVREAAKATGEVNQLYIALLWHRRCLELLRLRYPDLANGAQLPALRRPPNVAPVIFEVEDKTPDDVPRPVIIIQASYTAQQRMLAGFDGLRQFVKEQGALLPQKVRAFFSRVGVPDGQQAQTEPQAVKRAKADDAPTRVGNQPNAEKKASDDATRAAKLAVLDTQGAASQAK
jgi:hypothetical protein